MSQPLLNPNNKEPKEKSADSRPWFKKKRWIIPIGLFVLAAFASAGSDSTETSTPAASQTATATSEPTEDATVEATTEPSEEVLPVVSLTIPDLVGQNTSDAMDELEELGFISVNPQDATRDERLVLLVTNWYVCEVRPGAGTTLDSDKTVVLLSVKNSEQCPTGSSAASSNAGEEVIQEDTSREISSGTYLVGSEIEPGFYRVSRYFSRLDANQDIIDNDLVLDEGWTIVNVESTDKFLEISGVAYPLDAMPVLDPIAEGFTDGTYLVGTDIQPGVYRVTAGEGDLAYAARLACDRDIIDNDLNSGSVILTVRASDCLFEISGQLERLE